MAFESLSDRLQETLKKVTGCLLYTSDAADDYS